MKKIAILLLLSPVFICFCKKNVNCNFEEESPTCFVKGKKKEIFCPKCNNAVAFIVLTESETLSPGNKWCVKCHCCAQIFSLEGSIFDRSHPQALRKTYGVGFIGDI